MGIGLQHRTVDELSTDLDLPSSQLLGLFNRVIRRCVQHLNEILEKDVEKTLTSKKEVNMTPVLKSMQQELNEAADELKKKQKKELDKLKKDNLTQFAIKGSEDEWGKALQESKSGKNIISIKR